MLPAVINDPNVPHPDNSPWVAIISIAVFLAVAFVFVFLARQYLKNSND